MLHLWSRCVRWAQRARSGMSWRPGSSNSSLDSLPLPWKQRRWDEYSHFLWFLSICSNSDLKSDQLHKENTRLDVFLKINTSSSCQVSKTLKATLTVLLDNVCDSDCNPSPDVPSSLSHEPLGGSTAPKLILAKRRANQQETETYYFTVSNDATSGSLRWLVSLPCERRGDETVI